MNRRRTTRQLVDRLFARINYERQSGSRSGDYKLGNMLHFLQKLGSPHLQYPVIHVTGTKGKGSVSAMIEAMLRSAGMKTGLYSSPHLERPNERIRIAGKEISDAALQRVLAELTPTIDEFDSAADKNQSKKLTFFEVITAAACQAFANHDTEAVVLEVGMGGRLDSTNVCQPIVSVITNVSLDHTRQLGSTVDKIAFEKAGIIKTGVPVVSGATDPAAAAVIRDVAARKEARLVELDLDFHCRFDTGIDRFEYRSPQLSLDNLELAMIGRHQEINGAIAIAAVELLQQQEWKILEKDIRYGLRTAVLPGRCEQIRRNGLVVLDIAHNEASMRAFAQTLCKDVAGFGQATKKTLIFAASSDKDLINMLKPVVSLFDLFVVTRYLENPRARSCIEIVDCLTGLLQAAGKSPECVVSTDNPREAWDSVIRSAEAGQVVCIAGSVFLVAELRPIVLAWSDNC